jgi:hypothetical protein
MLPLHTFFFSPKNILSKNKRLEEKKIFSFYFMHRSHFFMCRHNSANGRERKNQFNQFEILKCH